MKASEVIELLSRILAEHGDLPVVVSCDYDFRYGEVGKARIIGLARHGDRSIVLEED